MIYIDYNFFNADIIADMEQDVKTILDRDYVDSDQAKLLKTNKNDRLMSINSGLKGNF